MRSLSEIRAMNRTARDYEPQMYKVCQICDDLFQVPIESDQEEVLCTPCWIEAQDAR